MTKEEIRIGNLVNHKGKNFKVGWIGFSGVGADDVDADHDEVEGIPLTSEWLLKFGFVLISEAHYKFPTHRDTFDKTKIVERLDRVYKFTYEPDDIDGEDWRNIEVLQVLDPYTLKQRSMGIKKIRNRFIVADDLQYVHQLQNLYFALTGEELTLKP